MKNMSKKTKIIIAAIILIIAVFIGFKIFGGKKGPEFKTENPRIGRITEKVEASGKINPVTQTSVGTQVSGKVIELRVDFNTVVKKGDLMAVIDPSTYESNVLQQQANLQRVQSVFNNAKRNFERYQKLYADALVAKSDLDNAETDFLSAQAQVTQAKATLDKAKIDLEYTRIISPVNGIVISKEVELGQTVAASFQTPTLFLVAEDLTKMQIEVNISEADISKIQEGQNAEFSVDAYPDVTFKGVVSQVRNSPTTIQNVVTYTVVVAVENKDLRLKPGMTANVSIITASKKNVLTISNAALRFSPPPEAKIKESPAAQAKEEEPRPEATRSASGSRGGQNNRGRQQDRKTFKSQGVWVQNKDGRLERIEVTTGVTDGAKTEITGGDIDENTPVITGLASAGGAARGGGSNSGGMRMPRF